MKRLLLAASALGMIATVNTAKAADAIYTLQLSAAAGCTVRFSDSATPADPLDPSISDTLTFEDSNGDAFLTSGADVISRSLNDGDEDGTPFFQCTGPDGARMTMRSSDGGLQHQSVTTAEGFTTLLPYVLAWTFDHVGAISNDTGTFDSNAQTAGSAVTQLSRTPGGLYGQLRGTITLDEVTASPLIAGAYEDTLTITVDLL